VSGRNDLLANLPQWLAGVGSAVVAMETTRVLGGDRRTRLLAALVVTPLGRSRIELYADDLLAAFWLAIAAYLAISELVFPTSRLQTAVWFGAALGLAVGTKGTALPFGIPWLLLFLAPTLRPFRPDASLSRLAAVGAVVLTLNVGSFVRNLEVFDGPLNGSAGRAAPRVPRTATAGGGGVGGKSEPRAPATLGTSRQDVFNRFGSVTCPRRGT